MRRTIVVGIDGSERSADALALARRVAEPADLLLLVCAYAADPIVTGDGGQPYARALRADAEACLARMGCPFDATLAVADRHPARALQRIAGEAGAELIVVGSSHTGRFRRVVPGSTGEHLLHGTPCPVAIAPRGYRQNADAPLQVVACACDATPEARRALALAEDIARRSGARLDVIRVLGPPRALDASLRLDPAAAAVVRRARELPAEELHRLVGELDARVHPQAVLLYGEPAKELVRASFSASLMVVGSRGYGPLRGVLLGAVSGRLAGRATCPVIVVPRTAQLTPEQGPETIFASAGRRVRDERARTHEHSAARSPH